jgi:chemotaxis protein MotB
MNHAVEKTRFPLKPASQVSFRKAASRLNAPQKPPPSETGNEIWFLTLSDLLMLLMICFVLLFGITYRQQITVPVSSPENSQHPKMIAVPPEQKLPSVMTSNPVMTEMTSSLESDLSTIIGNNQDGSGVSIERHSQYIILTFPEQIIFDSGQARIKHSAQPVLEKVADFIRTHSGLAVEIQGHTDDLPINNRRYPSNWELSADRATQVAKALMQFGISPTRLSTRGFGEYHPLYPNDTDFNRLKNRRVELKFSLSESA